MSSQACSIVASISTSTTFYNKITEVFFGLVYASVLHCSITFILLSSYYITVHLVELKTNRKAVRN